jgi:hypothetical protein
VVDRFHGSRLRLVLGVGLRTFREDSQQWSGIICWPRICFVEFIRRRSFSSCSSSGVLNNQSTFFPVLHISASCIKHFRNHTSPPLQISTQFNALSCPARQHHLKRFISHAIANRESFVGRLRRPRNRRSLRLRDCLNFDGSHQIHLPPRHILI